MKKVLVVLTMNFPYGNSESFIENEVQFYSKFDLAYIIPMQSEGLVRKIEFPSNTEILNIDPINYLYKFLFLLYSVSNKNFWLELHNIFLSGGMIINKIKNLISFMIHGQWYKMQVSKLLKNRSNHNKYTYIFYSYWFMHQAYAAVKLKGKTYNAITRCHRRDLYENINSNNYLPLRKYLLNNIDTIYSISNNGMEYLKSIYPYFKANIKVSRLGTIDYGYKNLDLEDKVFRIISCSWVVPVKRVDKIIEALAQISDLKLEWTHLGGGPILEEIKEKSRLLLNNKVIYKFPGSLTNQQIIKFYQENNFNLFINVSDSEGIPVSIMEAMSFGIPVIATDVGGVNEVVQDGHTGLLLNQNFSINELITKILFVAKMSSADYHTMRIKSRKLWEDKYNSKKNYSDFFNSVNDE